MATKNAPFYSLRAGKDRDVKSHRTREAAMNAAKEHGQIWITKTGTQRQVHEVSGGGWRSFKPDSLAPDLRAELERLGLIKRGNIMTAETAKHGLAPSADHYESVQTIVDTDGLHLSCECHSDVSFTSEPLAGGFLFECQECGRLYHSGPTHSDEDMVRVNNLS